jgi:hypothetical protein
MLITGAVEVDLVMVLLLVDMVESVVQEEAGMVAVK